MTLPLIIACSQASNEEKEFWERTLKTLNQNKNDFQNAKKIMKKYKIIQKCKQIAKNFVKKSILSLKYFPDNEYKTYLLNLAKESLIRTK